MSEHPSIVRLRELSNNKLRFIAKFAALQHDQAIADGEEIRAETYDDILLHTAEVLKERMELAAIDALVSNYRTARSMHLREVQ